MCVEQKKIYLLKIKKMDEKIIAVIPARMGARRFPGKPMADLLGMPMIGHVYHRAKMCTDFFEVFVATCDEEIAELGSAKLIINGYNCLKTIYDIDIVENTVSVNLLNQLDILLIDYLLQHFDYSAQELKQFRNYIQKNHINSLPTSKSCLITDHTEKSYNLENSFIKKTNLLFTELPDSTIKNEWEWGFDMNGYYKKDTKTIFEVLAIRV